MRGEWVYLSNFYVLCMDFSTYIFWSIIYLLFVFVVQVEEYDYVEMFYIFCILIHYCSLNTTGMSHLKIIPAGKYQVQDQLLEL